MTSSPTEHTSDENAKVYLPLPPPDNLNSENPQAELSATEKELYDAVLGHFTVAEYKLPGFDSVVAEENDEPKEKEGFAEGKRQKWTPELIEEEKFWLSYECILR
jgi:hypothetical protein